MDTIFLYLKKTLVLTVFVMFGLVATYIPQPHNQIADTNIPHAEALLGGLGGIVLDPSNLVKNTITAVIQGDLWVKEYILDGIAWTVAKSIMSTMVSDIVDWVGGGFQNIATELGIDGNFGSNSVFVQNLERYMREVAFEEADKYLNFLVGDSSFLCDPFKDYIPQALAQVHNDTVAPPGAAPGSYDVPYASCDLSEVEDLEAFISGDFQSGGWDDWFDVISQPEKYTPYGALLEAQKGKQRALLEAQDEEQKTLDFGDGFKSIKECISVDTSSGLKNDCRIVTPGKTITESLNKALGAGQDSLVNADELSEIIANLLSNLASKAISGASGLLGLSAADDSYSSGSYLLQLQDDSTIGGQGADGSYSDIDAIVAVTTAQAIQDALASNASSFLAQLDTYGTNRFTFIYRSEAQNVLQQAQENSAELQNLLDTNTTASFNASNYYTQADLDRYVSRWAKILEDLSD